MVRVFLLFLVLSVCGASPALGQQVSCAASSSGAVSSGDVFKALLEGSSAKMEAIPDGIRITGLVEIPVPCQADTRISADVVEIYFERGVLEATGSVVFADAEGRITAERVEFNISDGTGTFYEAWGTMSLGPLVDRAQFGNQDADIIFNGRTIEKLGAQKYRITDGGFTACVQPEPRWEVVADSVVINLNDYAIARNMVLRVKGVPLFYLPIIYYPIQDDERATGFLMPTYGTSTLRGGHVSNAFFWAINRSQDATLFHDWYTRIGQGMGGEYRYVSGPMSSGNVRLYRLAQRETQFEENGSSEPLPAETSYQINADVNQELGRLRAQGRVEYFTEVRTGQLYFRDPYEQTRSRRIVDAGISGNFGPTSVGAYYARSEVFTDISNSSVSGSQPRATINVAPLRLFGSPVYTALNADYAFLPNQRIRDGEIVSDDSLGRLDIAPSVRAPLSRLTYLSAVVSAAYRTTYYSRSLDTERRLGDEPITRQFLSLQSQLVGPVLTKIWDTPGSAFSARMKHVIEPTFAAEYVTDITNQARLPVVESSGTAVGGALKFTYGITNRVLARKPDAGATRGATREFLTIGVQQTFYSNPETSRYDSTYVSYALRPRPVDLSPVALTVRVAPVDGIDANARIEYDVTGNGFQVLTAGSTMTSGVNSASLSFSRQRATPLSPVSSYLSGSTALKFREGRVATFYSVSWDIDTRFIQNQSMGATYFAQCCGVQVDFQNVNFPRAGDFPIPSDRRLNFAFVLAGLGTFSNFFGAFGGP